MSDINVHEIRKLQIYKLGIILTQAMQEFQHATLRDVNINNWKYFMEFHNELIDSQIKLFRAMHLLDPWAKSWKDLETAALKLKNELNQEGFNGPTPNDREH
jgi:hypothetical protein